MSTQAYIIPRRNDIAGLGVQITDLFPNTSLRMPIPSPSNVFGVHPGQDVENPGQTHYVGACIDAPGTTVTNGALYISGSKSTLLAAEAASSDTTGGGANSRSAVATTMGLAAYLRERVAKDPGGANLFLPYANANTVAGEIRTRIESGGAVDATYINARLVAAAGGATALTGGSSFGSVNDIMRILSGEVYISPQYTIVANNVPNFIGLAARNALVAAQASVATGKTFVTKGHFLTSLENGYIGRPVLVKTGYLLASAGAGQIAGFASAKALINPAFSYGGAGTALTISGAHIAATGIQSFMAVYTDTGVKLA